MNQWTTKYRTALIVLPAALLGWAVLALFHPDPDAAGGIYAGLHDEVGRWLFVHIAQLALAPFVAFAVWAILHGISSITATASRAALVVWLVFFGVYDALAGIGTGVLVRHAANTAGEEQARFIAAVDFFWDSRLTGTVSWWGIVATIAWPTVAITAAIALRRAGAGWPTTMATLASGLIALHGGYPATLGFTALAAAVVLRSREQARYRHFPHR
jgi:hypothetical protein